MKKRLIALLAAVCLTAVPVSVMAEETEKDFSYLEEMSVKELKELRDAINEILGDGGGSGDDIFSKHPEWAEYDTNTVPYSDAIYLTQLMKDSVSNPSLFKLKSVDYLNKSSKDYYYMQYYVPTAIGGQDYQNCIIVMKDGDPVDVYDDLAHDPGHSLQRNEFSSKNTDVVSLDVKFIENMLE